jgi:hypothetical protein
MKEKRKTKDEKKLVFAINSSGLGPLPNETFEDQYQDLCKKLFNDIEEKKEHYKRLEDAQKKRYRDEMEERKLKE